MSDGKQKAESFRNAKGVLPWKEGDPMPEEYISAARGDYEALYRHFRKDNKAKDKRIQQLEDALHKIAHFGDVVSKPVAKQALERKE